MAGTRIPATPETALAALKAAGREENRAGMARFGIETARAYGVPMPEIRRIGKTIAPDHKLALSLWQSGIHEARILASLVDRPQWVTPDQMDRWVAEFDSWDVCDQVCGNLFERAAGIGGKIGEWAADEREFVRRAAFATIAWQAVHLKKEPDSTILAYLPLIERHSGDRRNFVKKAVNWALRQIGKRNAACHGPALDLARRLAASPDGTPAWIGKDAVKELESEAVRARILKKE